MTLALSKTCPICGLDLPLDAYYKTPKGKHGRYARCKPKGAKTVDYR